MRCCTDSRRTTSSAVLHGVRRRRGQLARAGGLAPRLTSPWRLLSHQLFWDALRAGTGGSAIAGHAFALVLHALLCGLLAWMLARRLGVPAALVGGAVLAGHFASFTAVWWLAAHGDIGAALLALAALALWTRGGPARWWAVPCFLLALLFKESVLPLPLVAAGVALFAPGPRTPRAFWRDGAWLAMTLLAAAWALLARSAAQLGGEAYALSPGAVLPNLLTYAGWALDAFQPTVRDVSDAITPGEYGWGIAWLAILAIAACVPAWRRRGGAAAAIAFVSMTLPVLAAAHHTYHYYLLAALPAAAWVVGLATDVAASRLPARTALAVAALAAALLVGNGAALVHKIETAPVLAPGLHADRTVDRALIASNAVRDVQAAAMPPGSALRLWSPQAQAMQKNQGGDATRESYFEQNVRAALLDGLGVRVLVPQVTSATFVRAFDPADSTVYWAVYRYDGALHVARARELARAMARVAGAATR